MRVHIDTLSITGKIQTSELATTEQSPHIFIQRRILQLFPALSRLLVIGKPTGQVNGYRGSFSLEADGVVIGHFALGGNEGGPCAELAEKEKGVVRLQGWQLYLNGVGCAVVQSFGKRAWEYASFAVQQGGYRITRVDLAADDLQGIHDLDYAANLYQVGAFDPSTGRPPTCSQAGNWFRPDGRGRTLYIGRRDGQKMLRIYEKGKQLGDAASPWVRWELELHHDKDRPLPASILARPASYFAGAYHILSRIASVAPERIESIKQATKIELSSLIAHAKNSYGKLVHVLLHLGRDVAHVLTDGVDKVPPRRLVQYELLAGMYATAGASPR